MNEPPTPPSAAAAPLDHELEARLALLRTDEEKQRKWRDRVWRERRALFCLLGIVLVLLPNFGTATVVGHSMEPQFHPGQRLLLLKTWRYFSPLQTGDIIVFRDEKGDLVKRVVFIQNRQGSKPWPRPNTVPFSRGALDVPPEIFPDNGGGQPTSKTVYVMGDNFDVSEDSRVFGPIDPQTILGKVLRR